MFQSKTYLLINRSEYTFSRIAPQKPVVVTIILFIIYGASRIRVACL